MRDVDWREAAINLSVMFFGVALVFTGLEIALQLNLIGSSPDKTGSKFCSGPDDRRMFHPDFGWVEHPNSQFIRQQTNLFTHNDEGFRDTYNTGEKNVIVVGDSFTQGYNVGDNATFSYLLDRWVENTSFHNYGMGGYGTDQELLVYKNISERKKHEAVVLAYYLGNDATDNLKQHPRRPEFKVENGSLELVRSPENVSRSKRENRSAGVIRTPALDKVQHMLGKYTKTYPYLVPKLKKTYFAMEGSGYTPQAEEREKQLRRVKALVEEFAEEAEQNNSTLIIAVIPERTEIYPNEKHRRSYASGKPYWDAQRKTLSSVAEKTENVKLVDPKEELKERSSEVRVYGEKDAHFSDEGYRILAKQIYRRMADLNIIESKKEPEFAKNYNKDFLECP